MGQRLLKTEIPQEWSAVTQSGDAQERSAVTQSRDSPGTVRGYAKWRRPGTVGGRTSITPVDAPK